MRLIITDLTEMHGGNFCVAGWDAQTQRMVRPLPEGSNWTAGLLQQHGVAPGVTVDVNPTGQRLLSVFPHRTEDTLIDRMTIQHVTAGPSSWFGAAAPPSRGTLTATFGGNLLHNSVWNNVRQGIYVPVGTQSESLDAVELPRDRVQFVAEFDKLKAVLNDGQARYKVSVSSLVLKTAWRQGGIQAVHQALPQSARFHVRLGLARAFDQPPQKCYLMVNGVHG
jgi:hypothetical protein